MDVRGKRGDGLRVMDTHETSPRTKQALNIRVPRPLSLEKDLRGISPQKPSFDSISYARDLSRPYAFSFGGRRARGGCGSWKLIEGLNQSFLIDNGISYVRCNIIPYNHHIDSAQQGSVTKGKPLW